jgi:alkylmercury lyase-like protein
MRQRLSVDHASAVRYGRAVDPADVLLRNVTYRRFVALGRAPTRSEVADAIGASEAEVRAGWLRLHDAHALVLDGDDDIRMANPFAAQPTAFRVEATGRWWYANCGWDAFGIGAAMRADSTIHAECADCRIPIEIAVTDGRPDRTDLVFHVPTPAATWWNDIGYT